VRVVLGGREESAWTDLSTLRLPERRLSVASGPSLPADAERDTSLSGAVLRDVSAPADPSATVSLPMIRERSPNHPAGGRRRAPETGALPAVSDLVQSVEPTTSTALTASTALTDSTASPARGRHRAPADPGRHRRADTGFLAVVPGDETPAGSARPAASSAARTESIPPVRRRDSWTAPEGHESDLLTRPMRLSDYEATSRRPRVHGSTARV
jgi:hypothetical protein